MEGSPTQGRNSRPVSTISTDSVPPPPAHPQQRQPSALAAPIVHVDGDEFDEARCTVLYDFSGMFLINDTIGDVSFPWKILLRCRKSSHSIL